jgi:hypothetical protein
MKPGSWVAENHNIANEQEAEAEQAGRLIDVGFPDPAGIGDASAKDDVGETVLWHPVIAPVLPAKPKIPDRAHPGSILALLGAGRGRLNHAQADSWKEHSVDHVELAKSGKRT